MKRRIEKRKSEGMKFFTPELYLRFNSEMDEVANRADEQWEKALQDYECHLDRFREKMSEPIRRLAGLCLHDAQLLALDSEIETPLPDSPFSALWLKVAILSLKQNDKVTTLLYYLRDQIRQSQPPNDWSFARERVHWLYDELDLAGDHPGFFHRILFSDGRVIEIPFTNVVVHTFSLQTATVVA